MNGTPNHIHMLIDLHSQQNLADLVRDMKRASNLWMKTHREWFPDFDGWEHEYAAFSVSKPDQNAVINYIKSQEEHHALYDLEAEYAMMLAENEMEA